MHALELDFLLNGEDIPQFAGQDAQLERLLPRADAEGDREHEVGRRRLKLAGDGLGGLLVQLVLKLKDRLSGEGSNSMDNSGRNNRSGANRESAAAGEVLAQADLQRQALYIARRLLRRRLVRRFNRRRGRGAALFEVLGQHGQPHGAKLGRIRAVHLRRGPPCVEFVPVDGAVRICRRSEAGEPKSRADPCRGS